MTEVDAGLSPQEDKDEGLIVSGVGEHISRGRGED